MKQFWALFKELPFFAYEMFHTLDLLFKEYKKLVPEQHLLLLTCCKLPAKHLITSARFSRSHATKNSRLRQIRDQKNIHLPASAD